MDDSSQFSANQNDEILAAIKKAKAAQKVSTSKLGVPAGWRKATFIVREGHFQKMKDLAYWERTSIKELLDQALERFFAGRAGGASSPSSPQDANVSHLLKD